MWFGSWTCPLSLQLALLCTVLAFDRKRLFRILPHDFSYREGFPSCGLYVSEQTCCLQSVTNLWLAMARSPDTVPGQRPEISTA